MKVTSVCLPWSSWSGFLVLDIKHRSHVIRLHTLGLPVGLQHAWLYCLRFSVNHEGYTFPWCLEFTSQARSLVLENSCLLIPAQEQRCSMAAGACEPQSTGCKRETRGCPWDVALWKEKGRPSKKLI